MSRETAELLQQVLWASSLLCPGEREETGDRRGRQGGEMLSVLHKLRSTVAVSYAVHADLPSCWDQT